MQILQRALLYVLLGLVLALPLATAAEADAEAKAVSATSLKMKRFGESFGDIIFKIKAAFTFNEQSKVELLKERNEQLKARQQAWLDVKAQALSQFNSGNLSAEQKQDIIAEMQEEHHAIIKNHVAAAAAIRGIELEAKSKGKADVAVEAAAAAETSESSELSLGLFGLGADLDLLEFNAEGKALTSAEAQAMVEQEFGVAATEVETEVEDGVTIYKVEGETTETRGNFMLRKKVEVSVEAETGMILSVAMETKIRTKEEIGELDEEFEEDNEIEIKIDDEGETEEEIDVRIRGRAETDSRSGRGASGRAEGNASIDITV